MNKVVLFTRTPEEFKERIKNLNLPDLTIVVPSKASEFEKEIVDANIFWGVPWMIKDYINKAPNVVWVQSIFAGVDALISDSLRDDYILTNVKDVYGEAMAEYVLLYILFLEKDAAQNLEAQKKKLWNQKEIPTVRGKTICILGTGSIGKQIARVAQTFGMKVLGYRNSQENVEYFDKIFVGTKLSEFLAQGDYVVNVLPSTTNTRGIFDTKAFSHMKESACFINVGRGDAVNEEDLVTAIKNRVIKHAVLDVFRTEPLPKDSPLWDLPGVIITPHISGYISSDRNFEIFAENYHRFIEGKELLYQIDFERGY